MKPVLTPDEMRRADDRAIAAGTPASVLMERAGRAVAWSVRRACASTYGLRVVVLCGKGNNGGDGLIAARVLEGWGARVHCVSVGEPVDRDALSRMLDREPVVIDAMYGTGFSGVLEGDAAWVAETVQALGVPVVAVDIPSGVDGATGAVDGSAVVADRTVALGALKVGVVTEPGRSHAGEVEVAPIGIDPGPLELGIPDAFDVAAWLPARPVEVNKWSVGGVLVVGGTTGMIGAPMLVSAAALRAGAGIVLAGLPGVGAATAASGTEVITRPLPERDGALAGDVSPGLGASLGDVLTRVRALVVGPGLGTDPGTATAVRELLDVATAAVVLDADGLNALAGDLAPLVARGDRVSVLTPHSGEYERLAGRPVGPDRVEAARELARRAGAVVVLKGPGTVVAGPDGRAAINPTGTPGLATAGTGDVLSGITGAFLARGMPAFEASVAAAWVHGAASELGPARGLVASDLVAALPDVLTELDAP